MLKVERFVCGPLQNNVYALHDEERQACAVVDPAPHSTHEVFRWIQQHKYSLEYILLTHGHFDHVFALAKFRARSKAPIVVHPADLELVKRMPEVAEHWGVIGAEQPPEPDILLEHGQVIELAGNPIEVRHTPGHSPGQVAFVFPGHAVVGDTLFYRAIGRYDLPGASFEQLEQSIREQLYTLPPETVVWPGHGDPTTIGEEMEHNPYVGNNVRFKPREL